MLLFLEGNVAIKVKARENHTGNSKHAVQVQGAGFEADEYVKLYVRVNLNIWYMWRYLNKGGDRLYSFHSHILLFLEGFSPRFYMCPISVR